MSNEDRKLLYNSDKQPVDRLVVINRISTLFFWALTATEILGITMAISQKDFSGISGYFPYAACICGNLPSGGIALLSGMALKRQNGQI